MWLSSGRRSKETDGQFVQPSGNLRFRLSRWNLKNGNGLMHLPKKRVRKKPWYFFVKNFDGKAECESEYYSVCSLEHNMNLLQMRSPFTKSGRITVLLIAQKNPEFMPRAIT